MGFLLKKEKKGRNFELLFSRNSDQFTGIASKLESIIQLQHRVKERKERKNITEMMIAREEGVIHRFRLSTQN